MARVLVVDDEPSISWGLSRLVRTMGHEVDVAPSAEEGLCLAAANRPDLLILDVRLPGIDGLTAMESFGRSLAGAPIVVITAFGDLATAVDAIHKGAFEYAVKPFDVADIRAVIERALCSEPSSSTEPLGVKHGMLGRTAAMQNVFKRIALAARSNASVLLYGESGTGKELAATAIHNNSERRSGPFVTLSFAALNPEAAEQEIFGVANSAGFSKARSGLLVQADGGTLFIDEVADLPLTLQQKLLHVFEHGEVTPLGTALPVRTRFRVVSATRRNLAHRAADGTFRHDLYLKLRTFEIILPPLRKRRDDILLLARQFAAQIGGHDVSFGEATVTELESRPWYGNVRELRGAIEHALVLARRGPIMPEHLPPPLPNLWQQSGEAVAAPAVNDNGELGDALIHLTQQLLADPKTSGSLYERFLQEVEPTLLTAVMNKYGNRCAPAARVLGLHRTTLKKKLTQYEIEEAASGDGE
jgi:two-component system, NtrC family, nitrogen regulation response regulator GlnG